MAIPILRIFSVDKAKEFYVDFLGFKIDWEHRFSDNFSALCAGLPRGPEAALERASRRRQPRIDGVHLDARHRRLPPRAASAKNYRYYRPGLEDAPWDARVMEVGDPFGNKLRFSEPNKADDPRA